MILSKYDFAVVYSAGYTYFTIKTLKLFRTKEEARNVIKYIADACKFYEEHGSDKIRSTETKTGSDTT